MKSILGVLISVLAFSFQTRAEEPECADVNGSYRGLCVMYAKPDKTYVIDLQYDINQKDCKHIDIKTTVFPEELSVFHPIDMSKGMVQTDGDETVKIYTGGTYRGIGFGASYIYIQDDGDLTTVLTGFEKQVREDGPILLVDETDLGTRMSCAMKPAEPTLRTKLVKKLNYKNPGSSLK